MLSLICHKIPDKTLFPDRLSDKKFLIDDIELMKEWNWKKNINLDPLLMTGGSHDEAYWICPKGHEYKARIYSRALNGSGCKKCKDKLTKSKFEYMFLYYLLKVFKDNEIFHGYKTDWLGKSEIDIYIPSLKVGFEYDGYPWHENTKEKDLLKNKKEIRS